MTMIQQVDKSGAPSGVKQNPIYQNLDPYLFLIAGESDDLMEKMYEIMQQVLKLLQELTALASGGPLSPEQAAEILGQLGTLTDETDRLRQKAEDLATKTKLTGACVAAKRAMYENIPLDPLLLKLSTEESKSKSLMSLEDQISKDGLNAIQTLAQTVAKGSMNEADVQRLVDALYQSQKIKS